MQRRHRTERANCCARNDVGRRRRSVMRETWVEASARRGQAWLDAREVRVRDVVVVERGFCDAARTPTACAEFDWFLNWLRCVLAAVIAASSWNRLPESVGRSIGGQPATDRGRSSNIDRDCFSAATGSRDRDGGGHKKNGMTMPPHFERAFVEKLCAANDISDIHVQCIYLYVC